MLDFLQRFGRLIRGVLSCHDRVVLTGTFPQLCHPRAMTDFLFRHQIRIFDYTKWAEPLREEIRENAERLARENGLEIDFIRRKDFRKEERVKQILASRGDHPGLVHIFSAMEPCPSFKPWYDKPSGKAFLKFTDAKCLHYYFYFLHPQLGLCYLRVPTWAPFRLQFYFNGHHLLASKLTRKGIGFQLVDNVFTEIEDYATAQKLADDLDPKVLHRELDRIARTYCPVIRRFDSGIHWSLMQVEYATDLVFRSRADLAPLYERMVRTAIHALKADDIATFLGRKLNGNYEGEVGNDFHIRIEGTRVKHHMGPASIKMYDKLALILRIETTINNVTFFKHHRKVEHRDGTSERKVAPLKKTIYSLPDLRELMAAANRRYLDFLASIEDPTAAIHDLEKISRRAPDGDRSSRGFNLFQGDDLDLFVAVARGEYTLTGFQNRNLQAVLPHLTGPQISRMIRRLRLHGLVKKIGKTYKYYLTALGRRVILLGLKLRELHVIPSLAAAA